MQLGAASSLAIDTILGLELVALREAAWWRNDTHKDATKTTSPSLSVRALPLPHIRDGFVRRQTLELMKTRFCHASLADRAPDPDRSHPHTCSPEDAAR